MSADTKSALLLRVPSLTKVEVRNFSLLQFPRWLCFMDNFQCLCDVWKGRSYVNANVTVSSIFKVSFIWSTAFSVIEIPHRRDPAKCQLLRLHPPFSFTKMLKALQVIIFTAFRGTSKGAPKNVPYWRRQTNVTGTYSRRHSQTYF